LKKIVHFLFLVSLISLRIPSSNLSSPAQAGYITVTGRWLYYFNTTLTLPVIWATVQIFDLEPDGYPYPVGNPVLTDGNGYFNSGPITNNDGPGEDGLDIIVGVFATSPVATIINPDTNYYYYNLTTRVWGNSPDGTLNVGNLNTNYAERGAWWIFSWHFGLTGGWYYLASTVNYSTPQVTALWPYGDLPTYWTNRTIHLPDWAAWYPEIILYVYAHHVMNMTYGYMPPALPEHSINETSNANTAWVEGWAYFFPLVVYNYPVFLGLNLETPHWCSPNWDDGDEVEGRVAGALWDIFDPTPDGYDTFSNGFTNIWNIMSTAPCDTFNEFWQAWNASGYPKQQALMAIFQNSIDYRGEGDMNADGTVNYLDAIILGAAWGSIKGDPGFDKRADLNYDDSINYLDSAILGANYGNDYDC
jgi:hypothetical protein